MTVFRRWGVIFLALFLFMVANESSAQGNRGALAGTISDSSGAVIPGAVIAIKNLDTGATYTATSNGAGGYNFPQLQLGGYQVTITKAGFKTSQETGVQVTIGSVSALDIKLETGGAAETVTVDANAPQVQTESSEVGTTITPRVAEELPLALGSTEMRSPFSFIFLAPGVVGPGTAGQGNFGFNQAGAYQTKISGGQNFGDEVLVDGISTYRQAAGETFDQVSPSVEALTQFKIITSTLPAQYGRTTGGLTSFNTQSGTNTYHGHIFEIFQNADLDANNWFNKAYLSQCAAGDTNCIKQNQRPLNNENDYGIVVGGPLSIPHLFNAKNKLFGFFSFEQYRKGQGSNVTTGVPIQAQRTGDFSQFLGNPITVNGAAVINPCTGQQFVQGQIFDPQTTHTVNGVQCRTPFAGNIIPSGRLSQVAQNVLQYIPLPNFGAGGLNNNYRIIDNEPIIQTNYSIRVDWNASQRHKLYGSYTNRENVNPAGARTLPGPADPGVSVQYQPSYFIRGGWDFIISPTLLNHFNVGVTREPTLQVSNAVSSGFNPTSLGLSGTGGVGFPQFSPGEGLANFGQSTNNAQVDSSGGVQDSVTKQLGRHSLTFGVDYRYDTYSDNDTATLPGQFSFSRSQTSGANSSSDNAIETDTGNQFASFLLGATSGGHINNPALVSLWIQHYGAAYLQDDFKPLKNLTLNLGVRYDVDPPRYSRQGRTSNFSPTAINTGVNGTGTPGALVFAGSGAGRNGNRTETWADVYYKDVAPRIGFSFAPLPTTALRGGYGIYYAPLIAADFGNGTNVNGFSANASPNSIDGFSPAFALDSGFPAYPAAPNLDPSQSNFQGLSWIQPGDGKPGMVQNWSLQLQQQLATDLVFTIGYVGQHSTRLNANVRFPNTLPVQYFGLGTLLNQPVNSPAAVAAGIKVPYAKFGGSNPVGQALRPFPQYYNLGGQGFGVVYEPTGMSTYNSLQSTLVRDFRNGVHLQASYTWSKTLTDADSAIPFQGASGTAGNYQAGAPVRTEKALSIQDIPQIFVLSYIYELPFGNGKRFLSNGFLLNELVGGWQIGGIQRYQTGQPLNNPCAGGVSGDDGCFRFNFAGDQRNLIAKHAHFNPFNGQQRDLVGTVNTVNNNQIVDFSTVPFSDPNANVTTTGRYQFGNGPRVLDARIPNYMQEDFSIIKRFVFFESLKGELRGELFNAFNRHIFGGPSDTNPYDGFNYGRVTGTQDAPRVVQFQARIDF